MHAPRTFIVAAFLLASACHGEVRGDDMASEPGYAACVDGRLDDCFRYGEAQAGRGDPEGRRRALVAFQFACLNEHGDACARLVTMSEAGDIAAAAVGRAASERASDAVDAACEAGQGAACATLARSAADRERKKTLLEQACEAGHGPGCAALADMLRDSWRLEANLVEALRLDEKACELGTPVGCLQAGRVYLFGSGVEADRDRAMELFGQACNGEVDYGCEALVQIFDEGIGVERDPELAARYAAHAAAANGAKAAAPANAPAFVVHAAACSQGDVLGCFNAGWFRAEGRQVARNIDVSRELFERACRGGVNSACGRWESIAPVEEASR